MPETHSTKSKDTASTAVDDGEAPANSRDYVMPLVHVHVPAKVVDIGFWGGLAGAVALGVVDPPLGVLLGAGVLVARHQTTAA